MQELRIPRIDESWNGCLNCSRWKLALEARTKSVRLLSDYMYSVAFVFQLLELSLNTFVENRT